ncbi:MAG: 50S ribosomal protein L29 [Nanoarchaeota archaeon]|nr:50S ribosomal protein L29 [Nanoarchaeota archaeon]
MAKQKTNLSEKEIESKLEELKIEQLKNPTKKKKIKREIARLLTIKSTKIAEKTKNK